MLDLQAQDKNCVWHPFTPQLTAPPVPVLTRGEGAYLYSADGRKIFDAISSWWVTLHGHCHPYLIAKVHEQFQRLDHAIFAGFTHEPGVVLAERILGLLPAGFAKVFYSDNGSTAVEVALKMALQYWSNCGTPRRKILAFKHAYHGDTFGAMAVSARSVFSQPFWPLLFDEVLFLDPPLRGGEPGHCLKRLSELQVAPAEIAAFIYEPLLQGAGGMLMQDPAELDACLRWAQEQRIICIADEVATGFGRTGKLFASDYLAAKPDIICLAKGLTGGVLPLSITACKSWVYEEFLHADKTKAFYHGHSFTANPLGCAAANASLDLLLKQECRDSIDAIAAEHVAFARSLRVSELGPCFADIRTLGTVLACEFKQPASHPREASGYLHSLGASMAAFFVDRAVLLRPLGNVIYCLPPYCSKKSDLQQAYEAIVAFAQQLVAAT